MRPNHRLPGRSALLLACALACVLFAARSRAELPSDDDPSALDPRIGRLDATPHELWAAVPARAQPLWIALQLGISQRSGGERALSGMLLASLPLERLAARESRLGAPPRSPDASLLRAVVAEADPPRLKPAPSPPRLRPAPSAPDPAGATPSLELPDVPPPAPPVEVAPPLPLPVRVTPEMARAAVEAALRHARLLDPGARIDAIASRARSASLLPELRLRVSRLVDEDERLAPTAYDPERRTASGGTSLWLEARATWRLDRVLFADEEIALERIRRERVERQAKLTARVLELLFAWQRAVARSADPGGSPDERRDATLAVIEAEASLDLLTGGWMTRYRAARD